MGGEGGEGRGGGVYRRCGPGLSSRLSLVFPEEGGGGFVLSFGVGGILLNYFILLLVVTDLGDIFPSLRCRPFFTFPPLSLFPFAVSRLQARSVRVGSTGRDLFFSLSLLDSL